MNFALFRRDKKTFSLVADVGPGSVGVALVQNAKPAEIILSKRISLSMEERDRLHEITATKQAFLDAFAAIAPQIQQNIPTAFYVAIRAPWATSKTGFAERAYEADFAVPPSVVGEIAREAMSTLAIDKERMFEAGVVRVELNGYQTTQPKGKLAHHVSVVVLESEVDPDIKQAILEACAQIFPSAKPILRSTTRALSTVIHNDVSEQRAYMHVECSAAATICTIVKKDALLDSASIPIGYTTIAKKLAGPSGLPEEILTLMRLVGSDACTDSTCTTILTSLSSLEPELVRQFGEVFAGLAARHRLPNGIILTTHPDIQLWLAKFLTRLDFSQFTTTMRPFTVEFFDSRQATRLKVATAPGIGFDAGLAIASSLVNNDAAGA